MSTSITALSPITLSDMLVGKIYNGKFLLFRTVMSSFADGDVLTVIEDLNGDVEVISLLSFQDSLCDDPNGWLPNGQILVIKEPFLIPNSGFVNGVLKCDSPSDIDFIQSWDTAIVGGTSWYQPNTLSFEDAKTKRNAHFAKKEYHGCFRMYDLALSLRPNHPVILLNRAAVLLNLGRNFEAFESAKLTLESESQEINLEKVHYRSAPAAYRLRNWEAAVAHYSALVNLFPTSHDYKEGLKTARARLTESKTGNFDIRALSQTVVEAMARETVFRVDSADYVDGFKTACLVSACEKPFGQIHTDRLAKDAANRLFPRTSDARSGPVCVQKPHLLPSLYALWNGEPRTEESIAPGVIDTHRIQAITRINSFTGMATLLDAYGSAATPEDCENCRPVGLYELPSPRRALRTRIASFTVIS